MTKRHGAAADRLGVSRLARTVLDGERLDRTRQEFDLDAAPGGCAWCPGFSPRAGESHGICPSCAAKLMAGVR